MGYSLPMSDESTNQEGQTDNGIDVEKSYVNAEAAAKLRRLADALERGTAFEIQIAGKRVYMPAGPKVEFEYSKEGDEEEIEIEVTWSKG